MDAAATVHLDGSELAEFAERRAGDGPVLRLLERRFGREAVEELGDARNYFVWWVQQVLVDLGLAPDDTDMPGQIIEAIGQALAATVMAFHHAQRARALHAEWKAGRT